MNEEIIQNQLETIKKVKALNNDKELYYTILTMGCQLNENDSEKISGMATKMGYEYIDDLNKANLYIINTCCVRENAEEKLFGKLGEVKRLKEKNNLIIAICGCMMQEKHIQEKIKKSYPYVDIIFGTHTLHKFPEDLYKALKEQKKVKDILDIDGEVYEGLPIKRDDKYHASVTIMYGCDNFCSYCIVPYVRGRERSRKPEDILNEIKDLTSEGYKEITLLGQNVNSYMKSEKTKETKEVKEVKENEELKVKAKNEDITRIDSFAKLLRAVNEIKGIEIIKFMSPHPKDFTDDVIDAIRDCKKISRIIHVPLQSGSTSILKKMNRKYTKEQYLELIDKIRKNVPNVSFSTDVIVGFPGETKADFEDTLDVVSKVNFEQVYMFIYSRRKGTLADKMENQIPEDIKHERFERLKKLFEKQVEENNKKYIGTTQKILVEGKSKNNDKLYTGRTNSNKVVVFEANEELIGQVVDVRIISEHKWYLKGVII